MNVRITDEENSLPGLHTIVFRANAILLIYCEIRNHYLNLGLEFRRESGVRLRDVTNQYRAGVLRKSAGAYANRPNVRPS